MHRGVHDFITWVEQHSEQASLTHTPPAAATELGLVEERIASPLPADLRFMLSRYNGGPVPNGQLLHAGDNGPDSMLAVADELAERLGVPVRDPELLFPFYRSDDGGILAFDRSAGPVADTWPIIDYYIESGEQRLVHRTFDGFCRLRVAEWTSPDHGAEFTLASYLRSGRRHVAIEPDVSIAHATVAHALRRAGKPEQALPAYLRAARCVPAQAWCDWEALKLAALLGDGRAAWESAVRLAARAPVARWRERETSPVMVADVLAIASSRLTTHREQVLRLFDQLVAQADGEREHKHIASVRLAHQTGSPPPTPLLARASSVPPGTDHATWMTSVKEAYRNGKLRDEDLLLDPSYAPLRAKFALIEVLQTPRAFM
ncbi:MAG TPA: SMI1/KNR4 family protein [Polyangiales bacterium]|nr:SMI1/KNR4 family protein [Polyangiales bacterium]